MESLWARFKGENGSLIAEAATPNLIGMIDVEIMALARVPISNRIRRVFRTARREQRVVGDRQNRKRSPSTGEVAGVRLPE